MSITFKEITINDVWALDYLLKWDNDEKIKHVLRPNFKAEPLADVTLEDVKDGLTRSKSKHTYVIFDEEQPVGCVTIDTAFEHLVNDSEPTGWISVCVGEESARGKGVGKQAMEFLELKCQELELNRIELGVFSFNTRAHAMYKRVGYQEIGCREKRFYYDKEWHDDIRLEKRFK